MSIIRSVQEVSKIIAEEDSTGFFKMFGEMDKKKFENVLLKFGSLYDDVSKGNISDNNEIQKRIDDLELPLTYDALLKLCTKEKSTLDRMLKKERWHNVSNVQVISFKEKYKNTEFLKTLKSDDDIKRHIATFKVTMKSCGNCKLSFSKMKRCSKCKLQYYCTPYCQKKDWRYHKKLCK